MAHFTCFVIVPSDRPPIEISEEEASAMITEPLAPYDEEIEIDTYKDVCVCIIEDKPDPECDLCKGTGIQSVPYNPKSKWDWYEVGGRWNGIFIPSRKSRKWSSKWVHSESGNIASPEFVLEWNENHAKKIIPYALVAPEEGFIERTPMGWLDMTCSDEEKEIWAASVKGVLEKYKSGHIVVNVDCHIV